VVSSKNDVVVFEKWITLLFFLAMIDSTKKRISGKSSKCSSMNLANICVSRLQGKKGNRERREERD